jgi:hypothetical protein
MSIDVPETAAEQLVALYDFQDLSVRRDLQLWKIVKESRNTLPVHRIAHHDLSDHEGVADDFSFFQQLRDDRIEASEVISQQGCIDEYHSGGHRRRGGIFS